MKKKISLKRYEPTSHPVFTAAEIFWLITPAISVSSWPVAFYLFSFQEKMEADDKLAQLEKSEQSLKSDISLVVEEKCQALNELTTLKGLQDEEQKMISHAQDELAALKEQLEETVESKQRLETDLVNITDTLTTIDAEKKDLDDQVKTLEEKMSNCQDERIGLEHELDVARQQLEAANEARIRAEQGQVKAQEQLESLRCMMDQEIAALKFQLSSETMKYETELKVWDKWLTWNQGFLNKTDIKKIWGNFF